METRGGSLQGCPGTRCPVGAWAKDPHFSLPSGTSLFPGPVHSELGSHRSGWSWSLSSATSLEQGWPRASGTAGLEAGQGAAQRTRS